MHVVPSHISILLILFISLSLIPRLETLYAIDHPNIPFSKSSLSTDDFSASSSSSSSLISGGSSSVTSSFPSPVTAVFPNVLASSSASSLSVSSRSSLPLHRSLQTIGCLPGQGITTNETDCCPPGNYFVLVNRTTFNNNSTVGYSCTPCAAGTYSNSSNATKCLPCNISTYSIAGSTSCDQICPSGTGSKNFDSACILCTINTYNYNGTSCFYCNAGTFASGNGSTSITQCLPCPSGYICPYRTNAPQICNAGTIPNLNRDQCSSCPSGYICPYLATAPQICNAGTIPNLNSDQCIACSKGEYNPIAGGTECFKCPLTNVSLVPGSDTCIQCNTGSVPNANRDNCLICPPSTFRSNLTTCLPCPKGSISSGGTDFCLPSPPGYEASSNKTQFVPCGRGYFSTGNGNSCEICLAGERSEFVSTSTMCVGCAAGEYTNEPGQSHCRLCGIGSTSSKIQNSTDCLLCSPGSFSSSLGSPECTLCLPGSWNNEFGKDSCKICPPGTYNPLYGSKTASSCLECPKGYYSIGNSSLCTPCNASTYSGLGADTCTICPAGFIEQPNTVPLPAVAPELILLGTNNDRCVGCPANFFSPFPQSTECIPCKNNTYSVEGSTSCSATCLAGFTFVTMYNQSNSKDYTCRACAAGSYQPITFDPKTYSSLFLEKVQCQKCEKGYITSNTGSSSCTACGWINGTTGLTTAPRLSSFYRTYCTDTCAMNEYVEVVNPPKGSGLLGKPQASCEICPRNNWCVNGTYRISCPTCDIGNTCKEHYASDYCLQCAPKHFRFNGECITCPAVPERLIAFIVLFLLLIILVGIVGTSSRRGLTSLLSNRLRLFNALEDASRVGFPYPYSFIFYFPWLLGLKLDATDVECYTYVSYTAKWIFSTFFPLIALLIVALLLFIPNIPLIKHYCACRKDKSGSRWQNNGRLHIILLTALAGGVIPFMASQSMKGFICVSGGNSEVDPVTGATNPSVEPYTLIDPAITCNSPEGFAIQAVGAFALTFALFLYTVGCSVDLCYFRTSLVSRRDRIEAKELWFDGFFGLIIVITGQLTRIYSFRSTDSSNVSITGLSIIVFVVCLSFGLWLWKFYDQKEAFEHSQGWSILSVSRMVSFVTDVLVVLTGITYNALNAPGSERTTGEETNLVIGIMLLFMSFPSFFVVFLAVGQVFESTVHDLCGTNPVRPFDDPETGGKSYRRPSSYDDPSKNRCFGYRERINPLWIKIISGISVVAAVLALISAGIVQVLWRNSLKCENREALYVEKYGLAPDVNQGQTMLMAAAANGRSDAVMNLCGDIHAVDKYGKNALMYAGQNGRYEIAWLLMSAPFSIDVDAQDKTGRTALVWSAISGDLTTVQVLRGQGADVSILDNEGRSAVWYAGELANVNTDPFVINKYGSIVSELSVDILSNVNEVLLATAGIGLLNEFTNAILRGANVNYVGNMGWRASTKASKYGSADMLTLLCTKGANLMEPVTSTVTSGILDLYAHDTRKYNDYRTIQPITDDMILRTVRSNAEYEAPTNLFSYGGTIGTSANYEHEKTFPGNFPLYAFTPLMLASYYQHPSAIASICTCGLSSPSQFSYATEVSRTVTIQNWNALFLTALSGCGNCITPLVSLCGSNVNGKDKEGNTPMFIAAMEGNVEVITGLCTNNADPNLPLGADSSTVLTRTAETGDRLTVFPEIVRRIVTNPCNGDINKAEVSTGHTPLIKAAINLQITTMKTLYQYQALTTRTDNDGRTALFLVSLMNADKNPKVLQGISTLCTILSANVDVYDSTGKVPLVLATERGDLTMVRELLTTCRANRNIHERWNGQPHDTPLMKAVQRCAVREAVDNGFSLIRLICSTATAAERTVMSTDTNFYGDIAWTLAAGYSVSPYIMNILYDECKINPLATDATIYADTAITVAARYDLRDMCDHLCRFHRQLGHIPEQIRDINGSNPLLIASWYGFTETMRITIDVCAIDINSRMLGTLHTPLMRAIINYRNAAVQYLLRLNADVYANDARGYSALVNAVLVGNLQAIYDLCNDNNRYPQKPCGTPVRTYVEYYRYYYKCDCKNDAHEGCKDCENEAYRKDLIGIYRRVENDKSNAIEDALTHLCAEGGYSSNCQDISTYLSSKINYEVCNGYCYNDRRNTCFSPFAKVMVRMAGSNGNGLTKTNRTVLGSFYSELPLHRLRSGDEVLSIDRSNGRIRWSTFYIDTHLSMTTLTTFIQLDTEYVSNNPTLNNHRSLKLTMDHYLPVYKGGCREGTIHDHYRIEQWLLPAKEVRTGDGVLVVTDGLTELVCATVTNVSFISEKGHSSPYTLEGTIIVDGIAASVYANMDKKPGNTNEIHHFVFPTVMNKYTYYASLARQAHEKKWLARWVWENFHRKTYITNDPPGTPSVETEQRTRNNVCDRNPREMNDYNDVVVSFFVRLFAVHYENIQRWIYGFVFTTVIVILLPLVRPGFNKVREKNW